MTFGIPPLTTCHCPIPVFKALAALLTSFVFFWLRFCIVLTIIGQKGMPQTKSLRQCELRHVEQCSQGYVGLRRSCFS
ncbi:hypothetical protein B0H13DRAFT_2008114, partial [Mycena leptocephala]